MGFLNIFSDPQLLRNKNHLNNLIYVVLSDGDMNTNEAKALSIIAHRLGMSQKNIRTIISNYNDIRFILPETHNDRLQQFWDAMMIVLADGKIGKHEMLLFENFGTRLGVRRPIIVGLLRRITLWLKTNQSLDTLRGEFITMLADTNSWE